MASVWVFQVGLVAHEFKLGLACTTSSGAIRVPCAIAVASALGFNLLCPSLHHVFGSESNDEVLDTGVAFPENLASV